MNKTILIVLTLLSIVVISACASQGPTSSVPAPGFEDVEEAIVNGEDDDEPSSPEVKVFNIIARQWDFNPGIIRVNQGDTVRLNIQSIDVTHGFALSAFGINERLRPGQTTVVEFVADKKGEHTFFCTVQCGAGHSTMRGKLIVN